ncbi:DUF2489 domain-containing protein [Pelagibaculum spongiae]|uniref:DUF2489 domain-containing protein n=1 Tax=Pelagibaculum spongiae TaxID=2080658 RepID=A0A2V1GX69_9GAMM|nr:DUF2489 domain-containing protein [Pelagibaculum spongiae]PVZ71771.1 DUF2489 domain-containing protein [Pelagibaculum spongiae]
MNGFWLLTALIIICPLAIYAGFLLQKLRAQQHKKLELEKQAQAGIAKRTKKIRDSVETIARMMVEQDLNISEGSIRIGKMLEGWPGKSYDFEGDYTQLFTLFRKANEFAILDERKELAKQDLMRQDYQRELLEAEYKEKVLEDAKRLLGHSWT